MKHSELIFFMNRMNQKDELDYKHDNEWVFENMISKLLTE